MPCSIKIASKWTNSSYLEALFYTVHCLAFAFFQAIDFHSIISAHIVYRFSSQKTKNYLKFSLGSPAPRSHIIMAFHYPHILVNDLGIIPQISVRINWWQYTLFCHKSCEHCPYRLVDFKDCKKITTHGFNKKIG